MVKSGVESSPEAGVLHISWVGTWGKRLDPIFLSLICPPENSVLTLNSILKEMWSKVEESTAIYYQEKSKKVPKYM